MVSSLPSKNTVPWFGARKMARELLEKVDFLSKQLADLGVLPVIELQSMRDSLEQRIAEQRVQIEREKAASNANIDQANRQLEEIRKTVVATEEIALLQEIGIYKYRHPLTDVIAYEKRLTDIEEQIKVAARRDGGAVEAATGWTVNGSAAAGRTMVRDYSKLLLRAFNAEADNLVRGLKPYKLEGAIDRLTKVADTIAKLGKTMDIRISRLYLDLRISELELTADYLAKQAEQKEAERVERERLREERKVQQEIERERARLEKERQHFANALEAIKATGDEAAIIRLQQQLDDVHRAIEGVDYRAANIRAGYVYVISNIGSFGKNVVKIGMTRRLDPLDRIRELSDASVPFNFDVHALFFSKDAVGIEAKMHERLADVRLNRINKRREFFRATPLEVKQHLGELAGELLQFDELPEALEYRQSLAQSRAETATEPHLGTNEHDVPLT
jgi:hypothetical protein